MRLCRGGRGHRDRPVILQVDRQAVGTAKGFARAVAASSEDKRVLLLVKMDEMQRFVVLSWD